MNVFKLEKLTKSFGSGTGTTYAIRDLDLEIPQSQRIAIVGHSGAGKSTLLNLLGGLDSPTEGKIYFDAGNAGSPKNLAQFDAGELDDLRKNHFGFVFQKANLLDHLSVQDNVSLVLMLLGVPTSERSQKSSAILEGLGMAELAKRRPSQLSGGERQRVAVARALAHNPEVVFADEPTGNLDPENSEKVFSMLTAWQKSGGRQAQGDRTLILVTHNIHAAVNHCDRIVVMKGGKILDCCGRLVNSPEQIAEWYCQNYRDTPTEPGMLREAELGLLELLRGDSKAKSSQSPVFIQNIKKKSISFSDIVRLSWEDIVRVQHLVASFSNVVLILCATLLGFAGLGFFRGGENLRNKVEELGPRSLIVDGLRVASLDGQTVDRIYRAKLPSGKPIADPEIRPVYLWNTVQFSFITNYLKEMDRTGFAPEKCQFEATSSTGRTIAPQDPFLRTKGWKFSSPNALEIVASADFLRKTGVEAREGAMVFIDTGTKPVPLTVTHVFDQDLSLRANYVVPDGFYQAFRQGAYAKNEFLTNQAYFFPTIPTQLDPEKLSKVNLDHFSLLGMAMTQQDQRLAFKLSDSNAMLPAHEIEILISEGLKEAGMDMHGFFQADPASAPPDATLQFGRGTVYLEKMEDLEPAALAVREIGLDPVDPQKLGMVRLFVGTVRPLIWIVLSFAILVMLVVLANLAVTMMDRVRQKWVEISIYRACGMSVTKVATVFFIEGIMLSIPAALGAFGLLNLVLFLFRGGKDESDNGGSSMAEFFQLGTMDSIWVMVSVSLLCAFACMLTTYFAKIWKLARSLT
jgi:putative ABC transport system ATP-binding protein